MCSFLFRSRTFLSKGITDRENHLKTGHVSVNKYGYIDRKIRQFPLQKYHEKKQKAEERKTLLKTICKFKPDFLKKCGTDVAFFTFVFPIICNENTNSPSCSVQNLVCTVILKIFQMKHYCEGKCTDTD